MPIELDENRILEALQEGTITLQGQFMNGSNDTFLGQVQHRETTYPIVYKPRRGEQPLWDFPTGTLARREVAAYILSRALGWNLVPPTIYRHRAPFGAGSVQLFIEHDSNYHYFNFTEVDRERLRPVAAFDYVINNADRKGSHVFLDEHSHLWLIDHGVCFNVDDKLRTVIWDFAGQAIPQPLLDDLARVLPDLAPGGGLHASLRELLADAEIAATAARIQRLLAVRRFPKPDPDRRSYPWPPV